VSDKSPRKLEYREHLIHVQFDAAVKTWELAILANGKLGTGILDTAYRGDFPSRWAAITAGKVWVDEKIAAAKNA
jgi:hypothetical protein